VETCTEARDRIFTSTLAGLKYIDKKQMDKALFSFGIATHTIQDSFSPSHTFRDDKGNYDIVDICYYDQHIPHASKQIIGMLTQAFHISTKTPESLKKMFPLYQDRWKTFKNGKACAHLKVDLRDFIWIRNANQLKVAISQEWSRWEAEYWRQHKPTKPVKKCSANYLTTDKRKHQCLTHEARLARTATTRYLSLLYAYVVTTLEKKKPLAFESRVKNIFMKRFFDGNAGIQSYQISKIMPKGVIRCEGLGSQRFKE